MAVPPWLIERDTPATNNNAWVPQVGDLLQDVGATAKRARDFFGRSLQLWGATTRAPLQFMTTSVVAAPADGNVWWDGTWIYVRVGGVTRRIRYIELVLGQTEVNSDANFGVALSTHAPEILLTGTLTAQRDLTVSSTGAYPGATFNFVRTGGGAFNRRIVANSPGVVLKSIATGQRARIVFGTVGGVADQWYLADSGLVNGP